MFKINYNYLTIFSFVSLLILIIITVIFGLSIPGQETVKNEVKDSLQADFSPQALATPGVNWNTIKDSQSKLPTSSNIETYQDLLFIDNKSSIFKKINLPTSKSYTLYFEDSETKSSFIENINNSTFIFYYALIPGTSNKYYIPKNYVYNESSENDKPAGIVFEINKAGGSTVEIKAGTPGTPGTPGTDGTPGTPGTDGTPGTPGTPGNSYKNAKIVNGILSMDEIQYNVDRTIKTSKTLGNVKGPKGDTGTSITAASINTNGNLIFDKDDKNKITVKNQGTNVDADIRGTRITGEQVTAEGKLEFQYDNIDKWIPIGDVKGNIGSKGDSYKDPVYDSNNGSLKFTKVDYSSETGSPPDEFVKEYSSTGTPTGYANIKGQTGSSFRSARIINEQLWLSEQDDDRIMDDTSYKSIAKKADNYSDSNYSLKGPVGVSYTNPYLEAPDQKPNELHLKFQKIDPVNTGQLVYTTVKDINGQSANIKGNRGSDGTSITDARISSEGELQLKFGEAGFTTIKKLDGDSFNLKGNTGISYSDLYYEQDNQDLNKGYLKFEKIDYSNGSASPSAAVYVKDLNSATTDPSGTTTYDNANIKGTPGNNGRNGSGYTSASIDGNNQLNLVDTDDNNNIVPFKYADGNTIPDRNLKGEKGDTGISYNNPSIDQPENGIVNLQFEKTDYSNSPIRSTVTINDNYGNALNIKGSDSPVDRYVPSYNVNTGVLSITAKKSDNSLPDYSGSLTLPQSGYQKYLNDERLSNSNENLEKYYIQMQEYNLSDCQTEQQCAWVGDMLGLSKGTPIYSFADDHSAHKGCFAATKKNTDFPGTIWWGTDSSKDPAPDVGPDGEGPNGNTYQYYKPCKYSNNEIVNNVIKTMSRPL